MRYILDAGCDEILPKGWIDQFITHPGWSSLLFPIRYAVGTREDHKYFEIPTPDELLHSDYYLNKFSKEKNEVAYINMVGTSDVGILVNSSQIIFPSTGVNLRFKPEHFEGGLVSYSQIKNFIHNYLMLYPKWYYIGLLDDKSILQFSNHKLYVTNSDKHDERHYDVQLAWITYYSNELMDLMGRERFDNLKTCEEKIELDNGLLITLQREPFDWDNPEHRARFEQAYDELGLDDFRHD